MTKRKKKFIRDPHRSREAEKYANPIPSREYILAYLKKQKGPMRFKPIAADLLLTDDEQRVALHRRLKAMIREGQIVKNRRKEYGVLSKMNLLHGKVIARKGGIGAVLPDDGGEALLLPFEEMRHLFHGDQVIAGVARVLSSGQKEAMIVEIIERATQYIVGRLYQEHGIYFIAPFSRNFSSDIIVPKLPRKKTPVGSLVKVKICYPDDPRDDPTGQIVQVIAKDLNPGTEVELAIENYNLANEWPEAVQKAIARVPKKVSKARTKDRTDLRKLPFVTIDGEDARDFDDAVCCIPKRMGGYKLYVAIADVSAYVKPNSALDKEALARGNSTYFPNLVLPMLPEELSNGICSLNPHVDRLVLVAEMNVTAAGELSRAKFYEALIISHARLTYELVAQYLDGDKQALPLGINDIDLKPAINNLNKLYKSLLKQRKKRGAIEFETTENRIIFAKNQKIEAVVPYARNEAHRIIEECMLLANVATAKFLARKKINFLYRNHAKPEAQKISDLRDFLKEFKLRLGKKADTPAPGDYAKLIKQLDEHPSRHLIQTVLLRSLSQAQYSPKNIGHFGLAFEHYCHFTSPIRRYPDLITHRAIKAVINGEDFGKLFTDVNAMEHMGMHCSMTERRSDDATRDAVMWMKCQYLSEHIGTMFNGTISAVTGFGIFVELDDIYVDGLVHISALSNDYFHFDAKHHRLVGEASNKTYRLGDRLRVKLIHVNLDERKIDLELVQPAKRSRKNKR